MNNSTPTLNPKDQTDGLDSKKLLKSAMLIMLLTAIFGTLSYAFIQLNAAMLKLSVPESLCIETIFPSS